MFTVNLRTSTPRLSTSYSVSHSWTVLPGLRDEEVGTLSLKMSLVSQPLYILPKSVHIWVLKYVDRRGDLIISRKLIRGEGMKLTSSRTHNKWDMAWRVKEISQSARRAIRLTYTVNVFANLEDQRWSNDGSRNPKTDLLHSQIPIFFPPFWEIY